MIDIYKPPARSSIRYAFREAGSPPNHLPRPIPGLWHKYKGYLIKEYFAKYFLHMSDGTFDMRRNAMEVHQKHVEPWRVTLVDTGERTITGGRLKRVCSYVGDADFCMTYGDGVSDIIRARQHRGKGRGALDSINVRCILKSTYSRVWRFPRNSSRPRQEFVALSSHSWTN